MHARRTAAALAALTSIGSVGSAQEAWATPGTGGHSGPHAPRPGTATTGGTDAIWFSAGIGNETHGLVGTLEAAP